MGLFGGSDAIKSPTGNYYTTVQTGLSNVFAVKVNLFTKKVDIIRTYNTGMLHIV